VPTDQKCESDADFGVPRAVGFAPIAGADAQILILGSLPGRQSIAAQQYYAHPQNTFWKIMAALTGADGTYESRCASLLDARVAVWDVLRHSLRRGSLDADIRLASAETNDFGTFLDTHPNLERVLFNGQTAARLFTRSVLPKLEVRHLDLYTLPSTSPAYAAMNFADKLRAWQTAWR